MMFTSELIKWAVLMIMILEVGIWVTASPELFHLFRQAHQDMVRDVVTKYILKWIINPVEFSETIQSQ